MCQREFSTYVTHVTHTLKLSDIFKRPRKQQYNTFFHFDMMSATYESETRSKLHIPSYRETTLPQIAATSNHTCIFIAPVIEFSQPFFSVSELARTTNALALPNVPLDFEVPQKRPESLLSNTPKSPMCMIRWSFAPPFRTRPYANASVNKIKTRFSATPRRFTLSSSPSFKINRVLLSLIFYCKRSFTSKVSMNHLHFVILWLQCDATLRAHNIWNIILSICACGVFFKSWEALHYLGICCAIRINFAERPEFNFFLCNLNGFGMI